MVTCTVKKWTEEAEEALKDCFDSTVWEELCDSDWEDNGSLTGCIMEYFNLCCVFPTLNPGLMPTPIKALLEEKRGLFMVG